MHPLPRFRGCRPGSLRSALLCFLLPAATGAAAAPPWSFGGQLRVRVDAKEHAGAVPVRDFTGRADSGNDFASFSARLRAAWTPVERFQLVAEGRDARTASDTRTRRERDDFDLYQGSVRLGPGAGWTLLLGRQELVYGEQRLLGNAEWSILGRSYDAVRLRHERAGWRTDVFHARPVMIRPEEFNRSNPHDRLSGIVATRRFSGGPEYEVYLLARNVSVRSPAAGGPGARDIGFFGQRWKRPATADRPWDATLEATAQFGSLNQAGRRNAHRAWTALLGTGWTWMELPGSPRAGIGFDGGTGDRNPGDGTNRTAETLFGTNHAAYGSMDLTGARNLLMPRLEASVRPGKTTAVTLEWRVFRLHTAADYFYPENGPARADGGYGRNPAFGRDVGQEWDLLFDWKPRPGREVRWGGGYFQPGSYVRRSVQSDASNPGPRAARWLYVQLVTAF